MEIDCEVTDLASMRICETNSPPEIGKKKRGRKCIQTMEIQTCHVCGDMAGKHNYYGGRACNSCRAFFRRSVESEYYNSYFCLREGTCEMDTKSRKKCQFCRYQACLSAGMKTTWVRNEIDKKIYMENRKRSLASSNLPTSRFKPILQQDLSKLYKLVTKSGYFDNNKVAGLGISLVREIVRLKKILSSYNTPIIG